MPKKSRFPFSLYFRDECNIERKIAISQQELDVLRALQAVVRHTFRWSHYNLLGAGTIFKRAENDVLLYREFTAELSRKPKVEHDSCAWLALVGLKREAHWLSVRLNASAMIHRAPVNSAPYSPREGAVVGMAS